MFVLYAVYSVLERKKEGLLRFRGVFFWISFWILAAIAVLRPDLTTIIANYLGIGRGTDLVVYASLAVMFFVLFRFHIKLEKINRQITKVVRQDALDDALKNK